MDCDRNCLYLAGSVLCAMLFSALFHYRLDICHTAFPLTFLLFGLPMLGMILGGRALFVPRSSWLMILMKVGAICANLAQLAMAFLSIVGLGLAQCS